MKEDIAMTLGAVVASLSLQRRMLDDGVDIPLEELKNNILTLIACYSKLEGKDLEGKIITVDINFVDKEL